jgi:hypothetical protein
VEGVRKKYSRRQTYVVSKFQSVFCGIAAESRFIDGPWSEPVTFNGNWNSLPLLDQWDYEVGRDGENSATGPSASFKPYPIVGANGGVLLQTISKPTSATTKGGKLVAKGATKEKNKP